MLQPVHVSTKWPAEDGVRDKLDRQDPAWDWKLHT